MMPGAPPPPPERDAQAGRSRYDNVGALLLLAIEAEKRGMAKWSIRDLWGRLTQKKALNPEMRSMLLSLDGAYEPKPPAPGESQQTTDRAQPKED
jgi:hypothetical protein